MTSNDVPPDCFRCAVCDGVFAKAWTDAEAEAEMRERYPLFRLEDCAVTCDNCTKRMVADLGLAETGPAWLPPARRRAAADARSPRRDRRGR